MSDPKELYGRLILFLENQKQLVSVNKRLLAVKAAGLNSLNGQIDWEGSPRDFAAALIGAIAGQGQAELVTFLKKGALDAFYDGGEPLGPDAIAELDHFSTDIAALSRAQWESQFLGMTRIIPFMVEELPSDFVPRTAIQDQIVNLLLEVDPTAPGTLRLRQGVEIGLHGFGGFGKTNLARAVCYDPRIRRACPDGVIWVTLGRESVNAIEKINDLGYHLTRKAYKFIGKEAAIAALRDWLENRSLLFVIDDVWNSADADPFLQGGHSCARLMTARSSAVFPKETGLVNVGAMQPGEARDVIGAGLPQGYDLELEKLGDRLGHWPILLQLANRGLFERVEKEQQSMEDALKFVDRALTRKGLGYFDNDSSNLSEQINDPDKRQQAVRATVEASLELLPQESRKRFTELGIFPEDQPVPQGVLEKLWKVTGSLDKLDTQDLVDRLSRLGLLQAYDRASRALRIHDVLSEYLCRSLSDSAGLHLNLVNLWGAPPKSADPYAWRWVSYHLSQAALASSQPQRHELTRQLTEMVCAENFQEQHKGIVKDLPILQGDLELALRTAVEDDHPQVLPLVVRLARGIVAFRRRFLRPDHIYILARQGLMDYLVRQVAQFQLDPNWSSMVLLSAAWAAVESNPAGALTLRDRVALESQPDAIVDTLLHWIDVDLKGKPEPTFTYRAIPDETLVRSLLNRINGQNFDAQMLYHAGIPVDMGHSGTLGVGEFTARVAQGEMVSTTSFLAEEDWPHLLAYAVQDPEKGMAALEEYLGAFTTYSYPEYRFKSLEIVMRFAVQHPKKDWVKQAVEKICLAALGGTSVEFEEGLGIVVTALSAAQGNDAARTRLVEYTQCQVERAKEIADWEEQFKASGTLNPNNSLPDRGDSWCYYLRRVVTLALVHGLLLNDPDQARALIELASRLRISGKAGYRVTANLALAESVRVWSPGAKNLFDQALEAAQDSAHNIQDVTFCARMTARVNAMRQCWWPEFSSTQAAEDLRQTPDHPDHAAVHISGHRYVGRKPTSLEFKPEQLFADTLELLAGLYNRPIYDFVRLNRELGWVRDSHIPIHERVLVPDPGFVPHLAARIAAEALVDAVITPEERYQAVLQVVPMAVANPTTLDTVLARLVLARALMPTAFDPAALAGLAAAAPLVETEPPGEPKTRSVS